MEKRKVQITGGGTYFVTLPKKWAEQIGVSRKSEISLAPTTTGSLLVVPEGIKQDNRVVINIEAKEGVVLERAIIAAYIAGFDRIEVVGKRITPEKRRLVRKTTQSLVGLEIMEESQEQISVHCLISMQDFPADITVRRIFSITAAMLTDAVTALLKRDEELSHDVIDRDAEVDRLVLVVAREFRLLLRDLLLESEVGHSRLLFHAYQSVAKQLERIADHAVKISKASLAMTAPVEREVVKEIEALTCSCHEIIKGAVDSFLTSASNLANEVLEHRTKTEQWENNTRKLFFTQEQPQNIPPLATLFDSLLRIREYGFNIAEIALNIAIPQLCQIGTSSKLPI
ncbi:hypothetical protein LM599_04540 [Candidatus Acetothermia bacterium]|nr:hypothetical protein [Candidatus Acetothermia bacterium]MCI2427135.1 hypothetical protein [Candidatus Acetothermia bacterium]MCI2428739.1 hypothetical protein [Candidatus Acetothermia bacterium]